MPVCVCICLFLSFPRPRWTCTRMCVITCSLPWLHMAGPCTLWGSLPVGCAASPAPARKHSNTHPHTFDLFVLCVSWASPVRIKFHMRQHLPSDNPLRQYHSSWTHSLTQQCWINYTLLAKLPALGFSILPVHCIYVSCVCSTYSSTHKSDMYFPVSFQMHINVRLSIVSVCDSGRGQLLRL